MAESKGKFGTTIQDLEKTDPKLVKRVRDHWGDGVEEYTPGELQHFDDDYGQADPRSAAARKQHGDFTARGGSGPKR